MKSRKIFLLLNGEPPKELPDLSNYDLICATDGGYHFLEENNIIPGFVCGDLDSSQSHTNKHRNHTYTKSRFHRF